MEPQNLDPNDAVYHFIGNKGAQHTDTTSPIPSSSELYFPKGEEDS